MICVSIVSHQHGNFLPQLLIQLKKFSEISQIILTFNISEQQVSLPEMPNILVIHNTSKQGFGKNHNTAFRLCKQPYFCVLNPDIEFNDNPFTSLLRTIEEKEAALVAPKILSLILEKEDSIRKFPTIQSLLAKFFKGTDGKCCDERANTQNIIYPDWVAGMFMLFRTVDFSTINGFDERYFLYYEDVDICARLHKAKKSIVADLNVKAIHHAQRTSHRNLRYMRWHLSSMLRYLWIHRDL